MVPDENEALVEAGIDNTPTLADQSKSNGWDAGVFSFGKAEGRNVAFLSSGVLKGRPDISVGSEVLIRWSMSLRPSLSASCLTSELLPIPGEEIRFGTSLEMIARSRNLDTVRGVAAYMEVTRWSPMG